MLEIFEFFDFEVAVDLETTQSWYAAAKPQRRLYDKSEEVRNFRAAARKRLLPDYVLEHLDALGIPPQKATFITCTYMDKDGTGCYQFSYRIAGNILSGYLPGVDPDDYIRVVPRRGDKGRCIHEINPTIPPKVPKPHVDLEFYVKQLPWALDEPPTKEFLSKFHRDVE